MSEFPSLDMTGWSIISYEMALFGLRYVSDATTLLQNQPRAMAGDGNYHPGADFIVRLGEEWCSTQIGAVVDRLKEVRFEKPEDDDRRVLLLLWYEAGFGSSSEPLADIIQMALQQSVRPS